MTRSKRRSARSDIPKSPEVSPQSSHSPSTTAANDDVCPACPANSAETTSPSTKEQWAPARKSVRKRTQRDYANLNAGLESDPRRWIQFLDQKTFKDDPFKRLRGADVGLEWLENDKTAMTEPIVIEEPEGLGMTMPPRDYTVDDVTELVGEDTPLEVIDVASQSTSPGWTLGKWNDYFNLEPNAREKILNVISLEISGTQLADKILPPKLVRDIDWVENYWPSTRKGKGHVYPKVQLYCLMGVANAWTDWHVDFAGSSVYYHILRGSKIFYFIRPISENLAAYEKWSGTELQNHAWLGDMVDDVYKVELKEGNTMIIPAGWIHAVYTPVDTLVFGGNFLHSYDVGKRDKVLRDIKSPSGVSFCSRVLESMSKLADFLVSEVRVLEGGSDAAKKEIREQIPSDRVKDAAAMARELRWRLRLLAGGNASDDDSSQKPRANGIKRKRTTSLSPALEDSNETFKNFRPKPWDKIVETSLEPEIKTAKGQRPDSDDWVESWVNTDPLEGEGVGQVRIQRHRSVKIRRTVAGLERHRIERIVEEWHWP
ncbi:hypothetical protein H0H92_013949 [Tricholoma furcatifolium]|nr:hypothetical protein H0H92_013949 [Tricholoma furcatifolium]